jgi:hypothetical protein
MSSTMYICGPYTGSIRPDLSLSELDGAAAARSEVEKACNVARACAVAADVMARGWMPYVPHLSHFIDLQMRATGRPVPYETWFAFCEHWLRCCDALFFIGPSPGADRELRIARELGMPVYCSMLAVPVVSHNRNKGNASNGAVFPLFGSRAAELFAHNKQEPGVALGNGHGGSARGAELSPEGVRLLVIGG